MESQILSEIEIRRFQKQIGLNGIGISGQEKIKKSKILIIGLGGIGLSAMQYLALSGVGEIGICDNNLIKEENLQNHSLFNILDLGKQKAITSKSKMESLNENSVYKIFNIFVSKDNALEICRNYDLVIETTNETEISSLVDDACFKLDIPMVHGEKFQGNCIVSIFNYQKGSRYKDFINVYPRIDDIYSNYSFGFIDGLIGIIVSCEAIKAITGIGKLLSNRILVFDPIQVQFKIIDIHENI